MKEYAFHQALGIRAWNVVHRAMDPAYLDVHVPMESTDPPRRGPCRQEGIGESALEQTVQTPVSGKGGGWLKPPGGVLP